MAISPTDSGHICDCCRLVHQCLWTDLWEETVGMSGFIFSSCGQPHGCIVFSLWWRKYFFVFPDSIDCRLDYHRVDRRLTRSSTITVKTNSVFMAFLLASLNGNMKKIVLDYRAIHFRQKNTKLANQVSTY